MANSRNNKTNKNNKSTNKPNKSDGRKNANPNIDYAKLQKLILLDLKLRPYQTYQRYIGKYQKKDIVNYLLTAEVWNSQVQLRYISKYLYNMSSHYKRLVLYFAQMLTLDHIVQPYGLSADMNIDVKKFKKDYQKIVDLVEKMNIKHEFSKILPVAFREDVFFGYIHINSDSFFIQQLNPDFCKISSIEDGIFNYAFNFNYFNAYPERLSMFPEEFSVQYAQYKIDGVYWRELDPKMSICIKVNQDLDFNLPPFVGVLGNLLDFEDFKDLRKDKENIGNYKLIYQKIPMRDDSGENNDYLLTFDHIQTYHNNISDVLPEQIGLATTPMELDVVDFERDRPDVNRVSDVEKEYWSSAGVSQLLFTGDTGSIALGSSINTDEMVAFAVLRQIERWINRFIKFTNTSKFKFRVQMLDNTIFNQQDKVDMYLESAEFGFPTKSYVMASMGMSPSAIYSMTFLENDVLSLTENMIPVQSAHTATTNDGGRPTKDTKKLSDSGAQTRDKGKNDNRAKK